MKIAARGAASLMLHWLRVIISPDPAERRIFKPGFQQEGLPIWVVLTVLFVLYNLLLGGKTFNLFLPDDMAWTWHDVKLPRLGLLISAGCFIYVTGICLFPRITVWLSTIVFSGYFLYGAANGAQVDLLFGFAAPLHALLGHILSDQANRALSWLWAAFQFPAVKYYSFQYYLSLYIFFTGILTFLYFPARKGAPRHRPSAIDILLFVVSLVMLLNYIINFADRGQRAGLIEWHDVIMGLLAIVVSIEMCRRLLGWVLPSLAIIFSLYALYGDLIPGRLAHAGFSFNEFTSFVFGTEGVYGAVANVYASYVFLFILFGAVLEMTKVGDVFVKLAFALVGHLRGGPAKAAVVSSGLVGMIIGSGAPNIVITGTFTIPMMKRAGFLPHFAAAVEAVAATGGILMPPVMGAVAFLMAAFTQIDYSYICLIAFVPALMYYFQLYMSVHLRSGLRGLEGMPRSELPKLWAVIKREGYLLLPVLVLILRLAVGRSPFDASLWAMVLAIALGFFREDTRIVGLPPLIADALGLRGWSADVDKARLEAEEVKARLIRAGRDHNEIEREYQKIIDDALAAPRQSVLRENWMLVLGGVVFVALMAVGISWAAALLFGLVALVLGSSPKILTILEKGALNSLVIGVTAGVVGVMLAGIALPGLDLKFPAIVLGYSHVLVDLFGWQGSELPMAIILCAAAAYVMGMGMTSSAAYILLSILAVPALIKLGVPLVNAHLMVLWFTISAPLTPPFALAAFIAAALAGADPMRTGFTAVRLAWALYVVPVLMAYTPILMNKGASWVEIAATWGTSFLGFYCCAIGFEGFLRRKLTILERLFFIVGGFLLFSDTPMTFLTGLAMMIVGLAIQYLYTPAWAQKRVST
jgi:TRAP-type uncharacterized transport system fused permease subunit